MHAALLALSLLAADPPETDAPAQPEFRGVWVATVANIDWPSKPGLPVAEQQAELTTLMDRLAELNFNAVVFQVRPHCDALYASDIEPWSHYLTGVAGQAPEPAYDPLELAVRLAHDRGMELHAWFNPYRAWHPSAKSPIPATHVSKTHPEWVKTVGDYLWLNPTHPAVADYSLKVIADVVRRYDVDGVHLDDYFYPYPSYAAKDAAGEYLPFPDDDTWKTYQDGGGTLSRDDWRRHAVDEFVRRMQQAVHAIDPDCLVGISPFGIWKPGHPEGVVGFSQYDKLYADAKKWLNEGWVDYFTPQLYWATDRENLEFARLLDWWASETPEGVHLWPGVAVGRHAATPGEMERQYQAVRDSPVADGIVHFSAKAILANVAGIADRLAKLQPNKAPVPGREDN